MWRWLFNRKSTGFAEDMHSLEKQVRALSNDLEDVKIAMRRNSDEAVDMYDKTRRLYYRLSRREKIDSAPTSSENTPALPLTRDQILQTHYGNLQRARTSDSVPVPPSPANDDQEAG